MLRRREDGRSWIRNLLNGDKWGVTKRPLRSTAGGVRECILSHDGQMVAFHVDTADHQEIHVATIQGHGARILHRQAEKSMVLVDWSPDGRTLAYVTCKGNGNGEIWQLDSNTGALARTHSVGTCPKIARFSPDGRWIAFDSDAADRRESRITILPVQGESLIGPTDAGIGSGDLVGSGPRWSHYFLLDAGAAPTREWSLFDRSPGRSVTGRCTACRQNDGIIQVSWHLDEWQCILRPKNFPARCLCSGA